MKQTRAFFNRFSIGVTALWLLLFALLPNIGLLVVTVLTRGEQDFVLPQFTLDNYLRLLDPTFLKILWESLWLAFMSTLACLLVGYPFAYRIARASAKMKPWLLPAGHHPVLDELAYPYLCAHPDPQGQRAHQHAAGVARGYGTACVLHVRRFRGVHGHPVHVPAVHGFAAVRIHRKAGQPPARRGPGSGASGFQSFWHVTFLLTLPGIIAGSMLVFLPSLGAFYIPEILGGAKSMLIGNFIKNQFMVARDWPLGAAASTILTLLLAPAHRGVPDGQPQVASRDRMDEVA